VDKNPSKTNSCQFATLRELKGGSVHSIDVWLITVWAALENPAFRKDYDSPLIGTGYVRKKLRRDN
jgi:hypothetical protein